MQQLPNCASFYDHNIILFNSMLHADKHIFACSFLCTVSADRVIQCWSDVAETLLV